MKRRLLDHLALTIALVAVTVLIVGGIAARVALLALAIRWGLS